MKFPTGSIPTLTLIVDTFACFVQQAYFHFSPFYFTFSCFAQLYKKMKVSILVFPVKIGNHFIVAHMSFRPGIHINITLYAGKTPVILIFQIVSVTELENLYGYFILPLFYIRRNIKLRRCFGILRVTYFFTIHPHIKSRSHSSEIKNNLTFIPMGRNSKSTSIRANRAVFHCNQWWILLYTIPTAYIKRIAEPLKFPIGRNFNIIPT